MKRATPRSWEMSREADGRLRLAGIDLSGVGPDPPAQARAHVLIDIKRLGAVKEDGGLNKLLRPRGRT